MKFVYLEHFTGAAISEVTTPVVHPVPATDAEDARQARERVSRATELFLVPGYSVDECDDFDHDTQTMTVWVYKDI